MCKPSILTLFLFISLLFCDTSQAQLPVEFKTRLDHELTFFQFKKVIHSKDIQLEAIHAATGFLIPKSFSMGIGTDAVRVLFHVSQNAVAPLSQPIQLDDEDQSEFEIKLKKYSNSEILRNDLIEYFTRRFPIKPPGSDDSEAGIVDAVSAKTTTEPNYLDRAPAVYAALIFTELLHVDEYNGWRVHLEQLQGLRGAVGSGSGSGSMLMAAFADPVKGQTPIYPVNPEPVLLTNSVESRSFFKGLPEAIMTKEADGTWEGYRYDLVPSALIDTGLYSDPHVKEPISFFFIRRVKAGTDLRVPNENQDFKKLKAAARETLRSYNLFQAALSLSRESSWNFTSAEAVDRYLTFHPEIGNVETESQTEESQLGISRLERRLRMKRKEHQLRKKIKTDRLMMRYFRGNPENIEDLNERNNRLGRLNSELSKFMKPSTLAIEELEQSLTALRVERLAKRLPVGGLADHTTFLLKIIADHGMAGAQYELAKMSQEYEDGAVDVEQGEIYAALAFSQGLPLLSFQSEEKSTVTDAIYTSIPKHPLLGRAWRDPRGLSWSEKAVRVGRVGQKNMDWKTANAHCLNLNSDPTKKEEVKTQLKERENHLADLRKSYYKLAFAEKTFTIEQAIRDASRAFGPISGCYLPSREEYEEYGIDSGYSRDNSHYRSEILKNPEGYLFWSSSANPINPNGAFVLDGSTGRVGFDNKSSENPVRCVCSP